MIFGFRDFDLDLTTLIHEFDLDILKLYCMMKMNILGQGIQNLEPRQDMQTCFFAPVTFIFTQ